RCEYIRPPGKDPPRWWSALLLRLLRGLRPASRANPSGHGFDGWLTTGATDPGLVLDDEQLMAIIKAAAREAGLFRGLFEDLRLLLRTLLDGGDVVERAKGLLDPNDWRNVERSAEGVVLIPLAVNGGGRNGTREYIRKTAARKDCRLTVQMQTLVTRVLFDQQLRATGVEYQRGAHLYRADPASGAAAPGVTGRAHARREVILSGGTFNTPQLLMLSGVGPAAHLRAHGIPVRVDLPGTGQNLQDRYEISVVSELKEEFRLLSGVTFRVPEDGEQGDPALLQWKERRTGVYTSNGAVLGMVKRSRPELAEPDLFIFGLPGMFRGYYPGYSKDLEVRKDIFTWSVLKAHTNNTAGYVELRSADPRDTPLINFKHFREGNDAAGADLDGVLAGVKLVRRMCDRVEYLTRKEVVPGRMHGSDDQLRQWIADEAWGHHACGTCRMGPESDRRAVVDGKLRVHGTRGLRVVDASVFPKIPGFFIVTPIYMLSEKISDDIIADARAGAGEIDPVPQRLAANQ
ncbi:MAG TPA: GMC oxidoreductase, partial [Myxococcales bacterium]|nr:GMC oxidoreductase [Myxococcales bacterium]